MNEKDFGGRSRESQIVVETITARLWERPEIKTRVAHVKYGYETYIPSEIRDRMRFLYNETARYIRFAPDFFLLDLNNLNNLYLLEYKCTRTPLWSQGRISEIAANAGSPGLDWTGIGQWEAAAFDNYKALWDIGARVAVLNYCAYHPRPLVCEFVDRAIALRRDKVRTRTTTGSRTPYVNLDLREFRSLANFLIEEHGLKRATVEPLCNQIVEELLDKLPISHDWRSPFRDQETI